MTTSDIQLPLDKEYRILLELMIMSHESDIKYMREALKKLDERTELLATNSKPVDGNSEAQS